MPQFDTVRSLWGLALLTSTNPIIVTVIMALLPFVGLSPFLNFVILYTVGRTALTRDQPVARPLPTHSGIRTHGLSV
jgi:hypothetical protein